MNTHTTIHPADAAEARHVLDILTAILGEPRIHDYPVLGGARQASAVWTAGTHEITILASQEGHPGVYATLARATAPAPWDMTAADANDEGADHA